MWALSPILSILQQVIQVATGSSLANFHPHCYFLSSISFWQDLLFLQCFLQRNASLCLTSLSPYPLRKPAPSSAALLLGHECPVHEQWYHHWIYDVIEKQGNRAKRWPSLPRPGEVKEDVIYVVHRGIKSFPHPRLFCQLRCACLQGKGASEAAEQTGQGWQICFGMRRSSLWQSGPTSTESESWSRGSPNLLLTMRDWRGFYILCPVQENILS